MPLSKISVAISSLKQKLEFTPRLTITMAITAVAMTVLIRTAWITDDAGITLRTVLNFIHGHGPVFNVSERVQVYTHPLWLALLSIATLIVQNVFVAVFAVSIALSLAAFILMITSISATVASAVLAGSILMFSKAYVDFSVSGMENPLSHLLMLLAFLAGKRVLGNYREKNDLAEVVESRKKSRKAKKTKYDLVAVDFGKTLRGNMTLFFLLCSLSYLSRPDLPVILAPLAILIIIRNYKQRASLLLAVAVGLLPVIAWTLFSLYYYGFPFPNTAYAKLGAGIKTSQLFLQGILYLIDSIGRDPLTPTVIVTGIVIGLRRTSFEKALALGGSVYIVYILYIGGDFMSGRFLTIPLVMSTAIIASSAIDFSRLFMIPVCFALLALTTIDATLLSGAGYADKKISAAGIADERGFYYYKRGLLNMARRHFTLPEWTVKGESVQTLCGGLGFNGLMRPGTYFVDSCGLTDPLLARIPAKFNPNWRIGHFQRKIPTNYIKSIKKNKNLLTHGDTKLLYDSIRLITRGDLNDTKRLEEIIRVNLGYGSDLDLDLYRRDGVDKTSIKKARLSDLARIVPSGTPYNAPGNLIFEWAVEIVFPEAVEINDIDLSLDNNDLYVLQFMIDGKFVSAGTIKPTSGYGMLRHRINLKQKIKPVSRARVVAARGDGAYAIGHFIVNSQKH